MRNILISIRPEFVSKILNGEKTIEIRKTRPSCELPCKVYIYCTKGKPYLYRLNDDDNFELTNNLRPQEDCFVKDYNVLNSKVVAEFTLNKVTKHKKNFIDCEGNICYNFKVCDVKNAGFDRDVFSLLDFDDFIEDYGNGKDLYAWHIENLEIYDKPKELSEFSSFILNNKCEKHENGFACDKCDAYDKEHDTCLALYYCHKPIKRPPQSYMFVEELEE